MFFNYLKVSIRNILRSKIFSVINILGLAVSMSICLLVIKMIFGMYSCDRFHENKNRIYRVITFEKGEGYSGYELATTPEPLALELEKLSGVEKSVKVRKDFGGDVFWNGKVVPVSGLFSDPVFFEVFSFELQRGDPATALEEPFSIILTPDWAMKLFGETDPMGETVSFKNLGEFKVTGITSDVSDLKTHLKFDCIASASTLISLENQGIKSKTINNWENHFRTYTFFMLSEGADVSIIENAFPGIIKMHVPRSNRYFEYRLQRLTDISPGKRLTNQMGETTEPMMAYILGLIAVILMLTASFTYTTLSVARAFNRAREVGVRKVFGANKRQLFAQFIGEAVVLSVISLNFAYIILIFLEPRVYSFDPHMHSAFEMAGTPAYIYLAFLLFAFILGIITGVFPSLYLSRFKPVEVFKDLSKIKLFSRTNLRKILIVVQFTISLFLIFAVIIAYKQVQYQKDLDMGYSSDNILCIELQEMKYNIFKNEILQKPGVESVTAAEYLPGTGVVYRDFVKCEKLPDSTVISHMTVDPDYLQVLNMELLAGKDFGPVAEMNPGTSAIINEAALRHFGFENANEALEYTISIEEDINIQIIGVVKDFIIQSADFEPDPVAMRVIQDRYNYALVKINPAYETKDIISSLEAVWKILNPEQLFRCKFFSEHIGAYQDAAMQIVQVLGFITILTIFISILGLLGMVVFNNENSLNEIGIRKVIGANNMEVLWTISKTFLYMMAIAVVITTPLTWFLGNMVLQNSYHRISLKPGFFITGILFLLILGLLTVLSQTWKAANQNPVDSLRYE